MQFPAQDHPNDEVQDDPEPLRACKAISVCFCTTEFRHGATGVTGQKQQSEGAAWVPNGDTLGPTSAAASHAKCLACM